MKPTLIALAAAAALGGVAVWLRLRRNSRRLKAAMATKRVNGDPR